MLSASKTYDGTDDLTGDVTIITGVGNETLTYTGATASSQHVATPDKYINAITLADGTGANAGSKDNYQLPDLTQHSSDNTVTISAATLTPTPLQLRRHQGLRRHNRRTNRLHAHVLIHRVCEWRHRRQS